MAVQGQPYEEWPAIAIAGPSQVKLGTPAQFTCAVPDSYGIKWKCNYVTATADILETGWLIPYTAGTVDVVAELLYNNTPTGIITTKRITITTS